MSQSSHLRGQAPPNQPHRPAHPSQIHNYTQHTNDSRGEPSAVQSIVSYQNNIKSNNQLFQQNHRSNAFNTTGQSLAFQSQTKHRTQHSYENYPPQQANSTNFHFKTQTSNNVSKSNQSGDAGYDNQSHSYSPSKTRHNQIRNQIYEGVKNEINNNHELSRANNHITHIQAPQRMAPNHRRSKTDGLGAVARSSTNNQAQIDNNRSSNQLPAGSRKHQGSGPQKNIQQSQQLNTHDIQVLADNMGHQSRQNNVNYQASNLGQKNSNHSVISTKSAQLQHLASVSKSQFASFQSNKLKHVSVEQAARNLKRQEEGVDTRNSNLVRNHTRDNQNQGGNPNFPFNLAQNIQDQQITGSFSRNPQQQNMRIQSHQQQIHQGLDIGNNNEDLKMRQSESQFNLQKRHAQQNESEGIANISIEQLKQLMKNPQVAQFLKEQIQIQQKQQQSRHEIHRGQQFQKGNHPTKHESYQKANEKPQLEQSAKGLSGTGVGLTANDHLRCNESNMNSDTSQEILKYQKEWAKQFHEQVTGCNPQKMPREYPPRSQANYNEQEIRSGTGMPQASSGLTGRDSSQLNVNNAEESQEQIALLPESAFTNNMQNLNAHASQNNQINFYQQRVDTEQSSAPNISNPHFGIDAQRAQMQNNMDSEFMEMGGGQSRNIMNGGKQLSLMTVRSDIIDTSAELILDNLSESQNTQKDEEDEYLTFQLCEGEEMNAEMANFIGIHMLNDGCIDGQEPSEKPEQDGGLAYQCPDTGSHFDFMDLVGRMRTLKQKRNIIDEAIRQESDRQKLVRKQNSLRDAAKQKQIQKQKKLKTQVQNILKSAQEDEFTEQRCNEGQMLTTEDDITVLDEQQNHFKMNLHNSKLKQSDIKTNNYHSSSFHNNPHQQVQTIYNTHDGRQKQQQMQADHGSFDHNRDHQMHQNQAYFGNQQHSGQTQDLKAQNQFKNSGGIVIEKYGQGMHPNNLKTFHQGASGTQKMHQASSLASNHASKISHISKTYHQHDQRDHRGDDPQEQIVMNIKQPSVANHQRFQSEVIGQLPGGTVIHSNNLSTMVNTNCHNTYQLNTAIGSARPQFNEAQKKLEKKIKKKQGGQQSTSQPSKSIKRATIGASGNVDRYVVANRQQKEPGTQSSIPATIDNQSAQKKVQKPMVRSNQTKVHLKQTANFGPQMNLMKSQIANRNHNIGHGLVNQVNQTEQLQNKRGMQEREAGKQSQKIKSVESRQKQYDIGVSPNQRQIYNQPPSGNVTATAPGKTSHQQNTSNSSKTHQRGIIIAQSQNPVNVQTGTGFYLKKQQNNKILLAANPNAKKPYPAIYTTQQAKNKIKSSQNATQQSQNSQANNNSVGRSTESRRAFDQSLAVTEQTQEFGTKQLGNSSNGGSIPPQKHAAPQFIQPMGPHQFQSHSFDFRQKDPRQQYQNWNNAPREQIVSSNQKRGDIVQSGAGKQQKMRSFDQNYQRQDQMGQASQQNVKTQQSPPQYNMRNNLNEILIQNNNEVVIPNMSRQFPVPEDHRNSQPGGGGQSHPTKLNGGGSRHDKMGINNQKIFIYSTNNGSLENFQKSLKQSNQDQTYQHAKPVLKAKRPSRPQQISDSHQRYSYNSANAPGSQGRSSTAGRFITGKNDGQSFGRFDATEIGGQNARTFDRNEQIQKKLIADPGIPGSAMSSEVHSGFLHSKIPSDMNVSINNENPNIEANEEYSAKNFPNNYKVPLTHQKQKRVTAVTRGVQNGTSARVNTFDNRGIQASQHQHAKHGIPHISNQHPGKRMSKQQSQSKLRGDSMNQGVDSGQGGRQNIKELLSSNPNQIQYHDIKLNFQMINQQFQIS